MIQTGYYLRFAHEFYARSHKKVHCTGHCPRRIFGLFFVHFALFSAFAAGLSAKSLSPATEPSAQQRIDGFIDQLKSDDATQRQAAATALISLHEAARPAILKLVKSSDPGLQKEAENILLALPWYTSTDPPNVKQKLLNYGAP